MLQQTIKSDLVKKQRTIIYLVLLYFPIIFTRLNSITIIGIKIEKFNIGKYSFFEAEDVIFSKILNVLMPCLVAIFVK